MCGLNFYSTGCYSLVNSYVDLNVRLVFDESTPTRFLILGASNITEYLY